MIHLRHMKNTLIDEGPITNIPQKVIHMREICFTPEELNLYWCIIKRHQKNAKNYHFWKKTGRSSWITDTPETPSALRTKFQKAGNHPSLVYNIGRKDRKKLCSKILEE
ncbi:unnamed protein product [Urochloa humidicola]